MSEVLKGECGPRINGWIIILTTGLDLIVQPRTRPSTSPMKITKIDSLTVKTTGSTGKNLPQGTSLPMPSTNKIMRIGYYWTTMRLTARSLPRPATMN